MAEVTDLDVKGCDISQAVEVGMFHGEDWLGSVKLRRPKALEFHTNLAESIREKWPHAPLPPADWDKRERAMLDAMAAAARWINSHRREDESDEEKADRMSILAELRSAQAKA